MRWPRSLFGRTAATSVILVILFQVLIISASYLLVVRPLQKKSTNDLAALIVLSAERWVELAPEALPFYQEELARSYQLRAMPASTTLTAGVSRSSFITPLEASLSRRLEQPVVIHPSADGDSYWVDIPINTRTVRFGFSAARIGLPPSVTMPWLLAAGLLLGLAASLVAARRLTRPLARLAASAARIGRDETPEDMQESGPRELASVARSFNRMAQQARRLLQSRTTLLAGLSEDLRQPIAQLRQLLERMRREPDPAVLRDMERKLDELNGMVMNFIEFTQGMSSGQSDNVDMNELLDEMVAIARAGQAKVVWEPAPACVMYLPALAVQRIVRNLLDNAIGHGTDQEVEVQLACERGRAVIEVHDRGPGIPLHERERVFQPFVRLDPSPTALSAGTGLGLAIAWQIAKAHGWELNLLERQGGGTIARLVVHHSPPPAATDTRRTADLEI